MKLIFKLILIFVLALPVFHYTGGSGIDAGAGTNSVAGWDDRSFAGINSQPDTDISGWVKNRTRELSPGSWQLLMQYNDLPVDQEAQIKGGYTISAHKTVETFRYLEGKTRTEALVSMETNVHEIAHGFFRQNVYRYARQKGVMLNYDNSEGCIWLSPSEFIFISFPRKYLFPSREIAREIPGNLRTFRFSTYIYGNTSTQSDGVIGLLDELNAYYLGSRLCFDMLEAYKESEGSGHAGLFEWARRSQSPMSAFYEFDFFIKEYLLYMRKYHPQDYAALRSYLPFSEAYSAVRSAYEKLIFRYQKLLDSEIEKLNSSGKGEAWLEDGNLWLSLPGSTTKQGTPFFSESRYLLEPVLESERYRLIEKEFLSAKNANYRQ